MSRRRSATAPGQLTLGLVEDAGVIRNALIGRMKRERSSARLIPELGIEHGSARVDLAVVDESLDGFEIKSSRDDLRRLPGQMAAYGQVFDRMTIVLGAAHLEAARDSLPTWWGLMVAESSTALICSERAALPNPMVDPHALAGLLWRTELEEALGPGVGRRGAQTAQALRSRLVSEVSIDELRGLVRDRLRNRSGWRVARSYV